jgi:DNA polymerase
MIVAWAVDDEPVQVWDVTAGESAPAAFLRAVRTSQYNVAHNAAFDRTMLEHEDWWPKDAAPFWCTMAMSLRHGLPGGLEKLSSVFKLPEEFHKREGREFIQLFCKMTKGQPRATRLTHPKQWAEFLEYAQQDIRAMREIYYLCPTWNDSAFELELWDLDQQINRRGVAVDVDFARHAVRACAAEQERNATRTQEITDDFVLRATQRDRLLQYLFVEHGVTLPDLRADTVERRLDDPELPEELKELLRLRLGASKASTAKYQRILEIQFMGRLHWLLQYCGANRTKRWSGRNVQPQNFPRAKASMAEIEIFIDAIMTGCEDVLYG